MAAVMTSAEPISAAEFAERRRRVEAATSKAGYDALVAFTATNLLGPSAYLTGYEPRFGPREVAIVILVPGGRATFVTYGYWDELGPLPWMDEQIVKPDLDAIASLIAERIPDGATRVGVAGYPLFPAKFAAAIAAARPNARLEDATTFLISQAVIKSAAEIAILRETALMTDAGVEAFLAGVRDSAEETEIAIGVEAAMLRAGADKAAFPPLIFSGSRVETGIGFAQRRRPKRGEQLNIVLGAEWRGYKMDIGRVACAGGPSDAHRVVMDTAAEMLEAMLAVVRPGAPVVAIPDAAARVARDRGMHPRTAGGPGHRRGRRDRDPRPHRLPSARDVLGSRRNAAARVAEIARALGSERGGKRCEGTAFRLHVCAGRGLPRQDRR